MKWNTFDGWLAEKLWVIKGQKSLLSCPLTGLPLFNENQVRKRPYLVLAYYQEHWGNLDNKGTVPTADEKDRRL